MEKKIRKELLKMGGIVVVLLGLGIYAHEFVIAGIKAKVALNLSIFAMFGLAASIAFRHVLSLRNEVVALKALQVDYGARSKRLKDPYARPAVVFREPELLGQGYRLITEELGKQDDLQISNSTVQTLLHDVDQRINDRKSTILYFSGLMVFLGLLGAFMGLMKTVHSVSDLIGAMDVSGKGGTDSFGKMIDGMKAPLNGMSVGFSSSLFGLMTSMVLGALERCMTSALKALRNEFEHWLSNLAALEGSHGEAASRPAQEFVAVRRVLEAGAGQLVELRGAIEAGIHSANDTRADLDRLTEAVSGLTSAVHQLADPRPLLRPITDAVSELARNQNDMLVQFRTLYEDAAADRAHIRATLATLDAVVERSRTLDGRELHAQLDRVIALQTDMASREPVGRAQAGTDTGAQGGTTARPGLIVRALDAVGLADPASRRALGEAKAIRREVRDQLAGNRRALRRAGDGIAQRLDRIEVSGEQDRDMLARLAYRAQDQQIVLGRLAERLETGVIREGADRDPTGLSGARAGMELLRRRLDARLDGEGDEPVQAPVPSAVDPSVPAASARPFAPPRFGSTD